MFGKLCIFIPLLLFIFINPFIIKKIVMKKVVLKFSTLTDFVKFRAAVDLFHFQIDFFEKTLTCTACDQMIKIAETLNLMVLSKENLETAS